MATRGASAAARPQASGEWRARRQNLCAQTPTSERSFRVDTKRSYHNEQEHRAEESQRSQQISEGSGSNLLAGQMQAHNQIQIQAQVSRSQAPARPATWSVQKKVNNNCAQLARWLAELAKIPPPSTQEPPPPQDHGGHQRTRAENARSGACQAEARMFESCRGLAEPPPHWQNGDSRQVVSEAQQQQQQQQQQQGSLESSANMAGACVCCSMSARYAGQKFADESNGDNLSALSASSSLLSQLLNSSLNQLIEIDNGSSTCCLCDAGQCAAAAAAVASETSQACHERQDEIDCNNNDNQQRDLKASARYLAACTQSEQQVPVDERDLLVVAPSRVSGRRAGRATQALSSRAHSTTSKQQQQQERQEQAKVASSQLEERVEVDDERHQSKRQMSALSCCDRSSSSSCSSFSSCSTLTAAVANDFERLRQQLLEVHRRRWASRKRDPAAQRRLQIGAAAAVAKQVASTTAGRQQQFVTFDNGGATLRARGAAAAESQVAARKVSARDSAMNNREREEEAAAAAEQTSNLLECYQRVCSQAATLTPQGDVGGAGHVTRGMALADGEHEGQQRQWRRTSRQEEEEGQKSEIRPRVTEGELINCSLITSSGQQHDSLLEVSKSAAQSCRPLKYASFKSLALMLAGSGGHSQDQQQQQQQPLERSYSSSQECESRAPPWPSCARAAASEASRQSSSDGGEDYQRRPGECPRDLREPRGSFINHPPSHLGAQSCESAAQSGGGGGGEIPSARSQVDAPTTSTTTSGASSGGQSRGSPASASLASSEVSSSLGGSLSSSSCAIRVTTTSDSSEDCSCNFANKTSGSSSTTGQVLILQQHELAPAATSIKPTSDSDSGPREVPSAASKTRDGSERPPTRTEMGLIGSRLAERHGQDYDVPRRVRQSSKQHRRAQGKSSETKLVRDRNRQIGLLCSSSQPAAAAAPFRHDLSEVDSSELCTWQTSKQYEADCPLPASAIDNHYIISNKQHQLSQAAQLYARNQEALVALPLRHSSPPLREQKRLAFTSEEQAPPPASAIFTLDPSHEVADRVSMVEARATMVRVSTSRDSSRPSSRASSLASGSRSARRHNIGPSRLAEEPARSQEPIYDVPSLTLAPDDGASRDEQRCLSPDQKYPPSQREREHSSQSFLAGDPVLGTGPPLDKLAARRSVARKDNLGDGHEFETRRHSRVAAIISHNQQKEVRAASSHGENISSERDDQISLQQEPQSESPSVQDTLGHSEPTRTKTTTTTTTRLVKRANENLNYRGRQREDAGDNKHKSFDKKGGGGQHGESTERRRVTTATKKVTCTQPSETITARASNANASPSAQTKSAPTAATAATTTTVDKRLIRHNSRQSSTGNTGARQHHHRHSQINNSNAVAATTITTITSTSVSSCSCSAGAGDSWSKETSSWLSIDDESAELQAIYGACSCSTTLLGSPSCSCCSTSIASSVLHVLGARDLRRSRQARRRRMSSRGPSCSCCLISGTDDGTQESDLTNDSHSPGSLSQAYLRRHQRPRRTTRRRRHRRPLRQRGRPLSVSSGRMLRNLLRHKRRVRRSSGGASGHRRSSARLRHRCVASGRASSHGGHAGCSQAARQRPEPSSVDSYKVLQNEDHEQQQQRRQHPQHGGLTEPVRLRSLIKSAHATDAPTTRVASAKSRQPASATSTDQSSRTLLTAAAELLEVLDEEDEEEGTPTTASDDRMADAALRSTTNLKTYKNEQQQQQQRQVLGHGADDDDAAGDRVSLIIGRNNAPRDRERAADSKHELDNGSERKPAPDVRQVNLQTGSPTSPSLAKRICATAARGRPSSGSPKARSFSPNVAVGDLNQRHKRAQRVTGYSPLKPSRHRRDRQSRASSSCCRYCCSQVAETRRHLDRPRHRHHHHRRRRSHKSNCSSQLEDEIHALRRLQRKLIKRLLELEGREISSAAASAEEASKQLKIEYLGKQLDAAARKLNSLRNISKLTIGSSRAQGHHRRKHSREAAPLSAARAPSQSSRFNKLLARRESAAVLAARLHDNDERHQRHRRHVDISASGRIKSLRRPSRRHGRLTNEGYPAAASSRRARNPVSGLLRWRRLGRPISGFALASTTSKPSTNCCRWRRRRRCSCSQSYSSSCFSASLITSLSRGAHLASGSARRRYQRRRSGRTRVGRNRSQQHERAAGASRPRRTDKTSDANAENNMTSAGQLKSATVGQLRDMQRALIASGNVNGLQVASAGQSTLPADTNSRNDVSAVSGRDKARKHRHELSPSLTLVADHRHERRAHHRKSSSPVGRKGRLDDDGRHPGNAPFPSQHYKHNLTQCNTSKLNMDKFLVMRADQTPSLAKPRVATIRANNNYDSGKQAAWPSTWQLGNGCQCRHCCLVNTLVRMDVEARRRRKTLAEQC